MKRKKEILFIIIILIVGAFLIILPTIINNTNNKDDKVVEKIEEDSIITIKVYGEISYIPYNSISDDDISTEMSFDAKKGITYGEIIKYAGVSITQYGVVDNNLSKRYFESSNIYIKSSFTREELNRQDEDTNGKLNINTATITELTELYGVGIKRAEKIINYIVENGNISSFEELKSLIGVSDAIIQAIKEKAFL